MAVRARAPSGGGLWYAERRGPSSPEPQPRFEEPITADHHQHDEEEAEPEGPVLWRPCRQQATFSVWESQAAMDAYARSGAHLDAIRAAARDDYFSESMFVRFVPLRLVGTWHGRQHG